MHPYALSDNRHVSLLSFSAFSLVYFLTFWFLSPFQSHGSCSHPALWGPNSLISGTALIWPLWCCHCWPLLLPLFFSCLSGLSSRFLHGSYPSSGSIHVNIAELCLQPSLLFLFSWLLGVRVGSPELQIHVGKCFLDTPIKIHKYFRFSLSFSIATLANDSTIYSVLSHQTWKLGLIPKAFLTLTFLLDRSWILVSQPR